MALLYIDMLGVRAKWHEHGRRGAEAAFEQFAKVIGVAFREQPSTLIKQGLLESDSLALDCSSTKAAVLLGYEIYTTAFAYSSGRDDQRIWLRGAIEPSPEIGSLRVSYNLRAPFHHITKFQCSPQLLDAIAVERSGVKGMRLLIRTSLITTELRGVFNYIVGNKGLVPFRRLTHSIYPERLVEYQDVLWMAMDIEEGCLLIQRDMANRLRWSAKNTDEFLQAAATQVVFNECAAIRNSLKG